MLAMESYGDEIRVPFVQNLEAKSKQEEKKRNWELKPREVFVQEMKTGPAVRYF